MESETAQSSSARFTIETVLSLHYWTPGLLSIRVTRDPNFRFTPGHYARIGLKCAADKVVWRPFSIVSSIADEYLEFFAVLVPNGEFSVPLSKTREGDTVQLDKASYGFMTIDGFAQGRDLWLLATGTGLGPYLSILRDPNTWNAYENVVVVHSVRYQSELAYRDEITTIGHEHILGAQSTRLRYIPVVTRELLPDSLSAHIPQLIENSQLENAAGLKFELNHSRIMVCGNPDMIGELRALFTARGFQTNRRAAPGQLALENYWLNKP